MRKNNDLSRHFLPSDSLTFIAGVQNYTREEEYPYRPGIKFEVVALEELMPFLFPEQPISPRITASRSFGKVYEAFLKNGIDSEAFRQIKFQHLGELDVHYAEVYFDDQDYQECPMNSWYLLTFDESGPAPFLDVIDTDVSFDFQTPRHCLYMIPQNQDNFSNYYLEPHPAPCFLCLLNASMQEKLFYLSSLTEINPTKDRPQAIRNTTVFSRACVFDVGQALCVGLYTTLPSGQFSLCGFFDLGLPHVAGTARANYAPEYQRICRHFLNATYHGDILNIILSHWHYDHFLLAYALETSLGSTWWYVPNTPVPAFSPQRVLNHIQDHNGTLVFAPDPPQVSVPYCGNPNLLITKMDYVPPGNRPDHIHHHSLYAQLLLQPDPARPNLSVFLAGDCTYAGIDANARAAGYDYLQASHHGGIYYEPPAQADINDIPQPNGPASTVIYSCNQNHNHLGHPLPGTVADHTARGWGTVHDTEVNGSLVIGKL